MSAGEVLYCQTGLVEVYEDYTIIGEPLTVAYRIEEQVTANQFAVPRASRAGKKISDQVAASDEAAATAMSLGMNPNPPSWNVKYSVIDLRGIGKTELVVQTYRPPKS